MKIGLVIDNPKRELYGHLLVTEELVSAGHEVYIIPMYQQGLDIPLLGLDAVLMNYVRPNNRELLAAYRELGVQVVVLDTEGGVLSEQGANAPDKWANSLRENGLMELVDDYLFWGQNVHAAFQRYSGKDPSRLHLTGNPRFDLCADRWRPFLQYPRKDYILVNTNFSAINPLLNSDRSELETLVDAGWQRSYVSSLFDHLRAVFEKYLETLVWLVQRNPHTAFVIRPHPFERHARYHEIFDSYKNVAIDASGNVLNVIAHARCVLHLNCGTATEACLMGKLPISMDFLNTDLLLRHTPLPSRISLGIRNREELDNLIKNPEPFIRRYDSASVYEKYIEPWFYKRDGMAYTRVARVILEACQRKTKRKVLKPHYGMAVRGCFSKPRLLQRVQGATACVMGSRAAAKFREWASPGRLTKSIHIDEIYNDLERLTFLKGKTYPFSVSHQRHPFHGAKMASVHVFSR